MRNPSTRALTLALLVTAAASALASIPDDVQKSAYGVKVTRGAWEMSY